MNYTTTDMGLASAMVASGIKVKELEPSDDNRFFTFVMDCDVTTGKDFFKEYQDNNIRVEVKMYWQIIKDLKSQIYQAKQGNR